MLNNLRTDSLTYIQYIYTNTLVCFCPIILLTVHNMKIIMFILYLCTLMNVPSPTVHGTNMFGLLLT